jgi:hypothetical protein
MILILMMEAIRSSETLVLAGVIRRLIPEDDILYSHPRENLKSYIALTGWALERRRNMSPVRYELGFDIPEGGILHSHRSENLRSTSPMMMEFIYVPPKRQFSREPHGVTSQKTALFVAP